MFQSIRIVAALAAVSSIFSSVTALGVFQISTAGTIERYSSTDGVETVFSMTPGIGNSINGMASNSSSTYWANNGQGKMFRVNPADNTSTEVFTFPSVSNFRSLWATNAYLFMSDATDNNIYRSDLDGSNQSLVVDFTDPSDNEAGIGGLSVYDNQLYWGIGEFDATAGIYRSGLDGSDVTQIVELSGEFSILDISVTSAGAYWIQDFNQIYFYDFDTEQVSFIVDAETLTGEWYVQGLAAGIDGYDLLISAGDELYSYDLSDEEGELLFTAADTINSIAAVPEPGQFALTGAVFSLILVWARRHRQHAC